LAKLVPNLAHWMSEFADRSTKPSLIRLDLRRSLRMHRRLTWGTALAALTAGAIGLYPFWPPTAMDSIAFLGTAAALVLASAVLGAVAAVAARNLDQRVYVGADVEHVLGVPAMEELPDFNEVPPEYSEVDLLRLANDISLTCTKGSLRRCLFTGTAHGTGVTTLTARVKQSLEMLERPAMLVDATGAAPGSRDAFDESVSRSDDLILTDAAPVTDSPDTEYLARFADCVVVVAESGVTTREQLHSTAECLRQLNVSKVGFVVNRVRQKQMSQALLSVPGVPPKQFGEAIRRALADPPQRAAPQMLPSKQMGTLKQTPPTRSLAMVKRAPDSPAWQATGVPAWLSDALVQLEAEAPQVTATGRDREGNRPEEMASERLFRRSVREPLRSGRRTIEKHEEAVAPLLDPAESLRGAVDSEQLANAPGSLPYPHETAEPVIAGPRQENLSRLSCLRSVAAAADLKRIGQAKHDAEGWRTGESASDALVPALLDGADASLDALRGLISPAELRELNRLGEMMPVAHFVAEPLQEPAANVSAPEAEAPAAMKEVAPDRGPAEVSVAEPSPVSPAAQNASATEKVAKRPRASRAKSPATARRKKPAIDEVPTLPSKRGQYRRKSKEPATVASRDHSPGIPAAS